MDSENDQENRIQTKCYLLDSLGLFRVVSNRRERRLEGADQRRGAHKSSCSPASSLSGVDFVLGIE